MEAKVPQRIDMEDRIIGPLTLTQFFYLLFGGLFVYLLNSWLIGPFRLLFYFLAPLIIIAALALAFLKIQDRPLSLFATNIFAYLSKPRQRTWQKSSHERRAVIIPNPTPTQTQTAHKEVDQTKIADAAKVVDTVTPQDILPSSVHSNFFNDDKNGGAAH